MSVVLEVRVGITRWRDGVLIMRHFCICLIIIWGGAFIIYIAHLVVCIFSFLSLYNFCFIAIRIFIYRIVFTLVVHHEAPYKMMV